MLARHRLMEEAMQDEESEPPRGQLLLEDFSKKGKAAKPKKRKGDAGAGRVG
jgi:hypothetical protein